MRCSWASCVRAEPDTFRSRFAIDSPLEEDGFEPSVPLGREVLERAVVGVLRGRVVLVQRADRLRPVVDVELRDEILQRVGLIGSLVA